jgi:uncharacterized protein (DUF302 family)
MTGFDSFPCKRESIPALFPVISFRRMRRCAALLLGIVLGLGAAASAAEPAPIYQRESTKTVKGVLDDAEFAVTERNFRITGKLHIGTAIRERGLPEFPDYEVLLFCNLSYTQQMLSLEPSYVNYCPLKIAVRGRDGAVTISAPMIPESPGKTELNRIVDKINALLRECVDFGVERWMINGE